MIISLKDFEDALPRHFQTDYPLYRNLGILDNQYVFDIKVFGTPAFIIIKSTIEKGGESTKSHKRGIKIECGEIDIKGMPSHIKRTKHWEKRLHMYLKYAYIFILRYYTKPKIQINRLTQKLNNQIAAIETYKNTGRKIAKEQYKNREFF